VGRPTTLTDAVQAAIVDLVRQGNHLAAAARAVGVPDSTLRGWLADPAPRFARFRDEIASAEAQAETEAVGQIRVADAKWWLERRHKEQWGRPAESRAQAAAFVQVAAPAAPPADPYVHFTADDWRIASRAFLNLKRTERGEPALLDAGRDDLESLIVEDLGPGHPGEDFD
jgi:hypothetical protein